MTIKPQMLGLCRGKGIKKRLDGAVSWANEEKIREAKVKTPPKWRTSQVSIADFMSHIGAKNQEFFQ